MSACLNNSSWCISLSLLAALMRRLALLLLLWCIFESTAWAACTGSSPTWTSTPDYASVSSCVTSASRNDTINVRAGSATWASELNLTKGVSLIGAGIGNTIITSSQNPVILIAPDATAISNSETIRVSGFTLDGNNTAGAAIQASGAASNGTKPWKTLIIDDNKIQNFAATTDGCINTARGQTRGVIYKNIFDRCGMILRPLGNDDTVEWENPAYNQFTYGMADQLFFEDNTILYSSAYTGNGNSAIIQSDQGMRVVVRFNSWNVVNLNQGGTDFSDTHGFQNYNGSSNGQSGTFIVEYYDNTLVGSVEAGVGRMFNHRGSWGMHFDNTYTGPSNMYSNVDQYNGGCTNQIVPAPISYNPLVNNTYSFHNLSNGTELPMTSGPANACGVTENNNWWNYKASFNGTVGIGRGPIASRPNTCTTGVGYWATDQGSWNAKLPTNTSGILYKCTAPNTWTPYYTPYTYPHPLRTGSSSSSISPPSDLTATIQ
jgi:hypothetical protein